MKSSTQYIINRFNLNTYTVKKLVAASTAV
jgi:hypothetical protein